MTLNKPAAREMTAIADVASTPIIPASVNRKKRVLRDWVIPLGAPLVMLGVIAAWGWLSFGSVVVAIRFLRGERIIVHPRICVVQPTDSELPMRATFNVYNLSDEPLRLTGVETHCTCVVTDALPITVQAGDRYALNVAVRLKAQQEAIGESLVLFTDNGGTRSVPLFVRGPASR